jgi:PAS domain S-box-containing protein
MKSPDRTKKYPLLLLGAWTMVIAFSLASNLYEAWEDSIEDARREAHDYYHFTLAYRTWATDMGSLYASIDRVSPNPYMTVPERDITTISGKKLTLINPAHMTRLVFNALGRSGSPVIGKLVSRNNIHPANAPDLFEEEALLAFEKGQREASEQTTLDGKSYVRLIKPFVTEKGCVHCHSAQGHKVGAILGGLSIAVPLEFHVNNGISQLLLNHILLWLGVGAGIVVVARKSYKQQQIISESEWKFRLLAGATKDWEFWWGAEKQVLFMAPSCMEVTGYAAEDFMRNPDLIAQIIHPEDREAWECHVKDFLACQDDHLEIRIVTKDGSVKWLSHACSPIYVDDLFLGRRSSNRDITRHKRDEEEIKQTAARLNEAQHIAHLGNGEFDLTDNKLFWSDEIYRIFEIASEAFAVSYEAFLATIHPEDRDMVAAAYKDSVENRKPYNIIHRLLMSEGRVKHVQERCATIYDDNGNPVRSAGTVQDITEQKKAEEEINFLASIVRCVPDAVCSIDRGGKITSWNKGAEKMFGHLQEDIIGQSVTVTIPEEVAAAELDHCICVLNKDGYFTGHESERLTKLGERLPIEMTGVALRDKGMNVRGYAVIMRDITERKAAAAKVQRQLNRLAALRSIDQAITSSVDIRVTLDVVIDKVSAQLNADAVSLLIKKPYHYLFEYTAGRGFKTDAAKKVRVRIGQGYAGRVALTRESLLVPDIAAGKEVPDQPSFLTKEGFQAYFGVPLIAKSGVIGVLEVLFRRPFDPGAEWVDFLETLAGQATIAVENAGLFTELQQSNNELLLAYGTTLEGWSRALDYRDKETEGHSERVTDMAVEIARAMGQSEEAIMHIRRGALLHDIGKLGVPDNILLKTEPLTDEEWILMKRHPQIAYDILHPIAYLRPAVDIPYCHHEKWDGSGYPRGLKGEEIPLMARIFSIVDVWDTLRSDRPYRQGWSHDKIKDYIRSLAGIEFDSRIVEVFLTHIDQNEGPTDQLTA